MLHFADGVKIEANSVRWFDGETMKITVQDGDDATTDFTVHKALLIARSKYFVALPNFKEGQENQIKFAGWSIKAFRYVVAWLYQGRIDPLYDDIYAMIRAYAIADFLMISKLKNDIIDNIRMYFRIGGKDIIDSGDLVTLKTLELPMTDQLVQFITDLAAFDIANEAVCSRRILTDLGTRRIISEGGDIALLLMEKTLRNLQEATDEKRKFLANVGDPSEAEGCCYHIHDDDDEDCGKCK